MSKPESAVILSSIGLDFQIIGWILASVFIEFWFRGPYMGMMFEPLYAFNWYPVYAVFGLFAIVIGIIGILLIENGQKERVQAGSVLLIIGAIFAFPIMFGLMVGSILMFIAGILGLVWQPEVNGQ
ncbi:MAG: hypothetical protein ACP5TZ_03160 [Nitrososphaeria archaeon]